MIPVSTNITLRPKDGCTPVSSSCVVWNGPDIPCINLCQGDSIESVVHQLATLLCESTSGVIDVTTLDFKCLVENQQSPDTLLDALQALIDKVCDLEDCCDSGGGGQTPTPTPIALPVCLYFTQNGDTITQLLPAAYSAYLADKICTILTTITSIQSTLGSLNTRVTTLEETVEELGGDPDPIEVEVNCASGETPGLVVPIQEAFVNFENKFCQLQGLLGTLSSLNDVITQGCSDLSDSPQLCDEESTMSDLPNWILYPGTVSETISNMWLTICDLRCSVQGLITGGVTECVTLPPTNVQITDLTSSGCTVKWNIPQTGSFEDPTDYVVTITEWNGTSKVGTPIATATVSHPAIESVFSTVGDPSKIYIAEVYAAYSCGDSPIASAIGPVQLSSIQYILNVTDLITASEVTYPCDGNSLPAVQRITTVSLSNPGIGGVAINNGSTITAVLRFSLTGDCINAYSEDVTINIVTGQSSATYTYLGEKMKKCGSNPCTPEFKEFLCVVSVSSQAVALHPSVSFCQNE